MQGDVIDSWEERLRLTLDHFRNENMADFRKNSEAYIASGGKGRAGKAGL